MHLILGLVAIVAVVCIFAAVAEKLRGSAPLVLMAVGLVGSFLPFVPRVELSSELVLAGMLPPLLYSAAIRTSLVDFRTNRAAIMQLSVGYVIFGTVTVGFAAHYLLDVPLAAAFALAAVLAPPDAVAATAVARRTGMPRRLVDILEGESLVNDASAIVCLRTAIAAMAGAVSAWQIAGSFALAAGGGVAVGVVIAIAIIKLRPRIHEVAMDTAISLAVPFLAYAVAELVHASGVLAVVVAGLLIGHKSPMVQSGPSRLSERVNWATIQFLLENAVFLLIGLQVRWIIEDVAGDSLGPARIWWGCAGVLLAVLVLRPVWIFVTSYLPNRIRGTEIPWQYLVIVSWAGMRGVVTLAASLILPPETPHRAVLVLCALLVVVGTLVLQGLTLPWLIRILKVRGPDAREDQLQQAVVLQSTADAGIAELERIRRPDDPQVLVEALRDRMEQRRLAAWERLGRSGATGETPSQRFLRLRLAMLAAERTRVLELRHEAQIPQHVLRDVLEVLDVEEALTTSWADPSEEPVSADELVAPASLRGDCEHLQCAPVSVAPTTAGYCQACVDEGLESVHLRVCLECGTVGCCDSSPGKHAAAHHEATGHPVMRSIEPGEAWRWCYVDNLLG